LERVAGYAKRHLVLYSAPAILGSFRLFARWLQVMNVSTRKTGFARPGAFLSWLVALLCLAAVFVLLFSVLRLRRYRAPVEPAAAFQGGSLFRLLMSASALLTAAGAALFFLHGECSHGSWPCWASPPRAVCSFIPPRRNGGISAV
jgi:hypothetical protein